jgi:hypothetical protein
MRFITTFNNLFLLLDENKYWPPFTLKIKLQIKDLTNNENSIWNTYGRFFIVLLGKEAKGSFLVPLIVHEN